MHARDLGPLFLWPVAPLVGRVSVRAGVWRAGGGRLCGASVGWLDPRPPFFKEKRPRSPPSTSRASRTTRRARVAYGRCRRLVSDARRSCRVVLLEMQLHLVCSIVSPYI